VFFSSAKAFLSAGIAFFLFLLFLLLPSKFLPTFPIYSSLSLAAAVFASLCVPLE